MRFAGTAADTSSTPAGAPLQRVTRRRVEQVIGTPGLQSSLNHAKLAYRAGRPSNFRNLAVGLGGSADAHYWNPTDFWNIREMAREWDRNTPILGQLVDRGLDQTLGTGLRIDPTTGDLATDIALRELWGDWSTDPRACDHQGRHTFDKLERLGLRHRWIDGDAFFILDERSGSVRMEEGDRVDSTTAERVIMGDLGNAVAEMIHGVELDLAGKPMAYHFMQLRPGERQINRRVFPSIHNRQMVRVPAEFVVHVFDPKRVTQTRGVTAFSGVFDRIGLLDDLEFAQLVQQQVAACIAAFVESEFTPQWGPRDTSTSLSDGETEILTDEFSPGMVVRLNPGEKVSTFSPNNPTDNAREQAKQIIREIGLSIGLPLELSLLVTSDTTFHGYRGVVEAYKQTARVVQRDYAAQLRSRVYRWKVSQWVAQGLLPDLPTIARHRIQYPAWQYVDPLKDAQADALRVSEHLASPRHIWAERGLDYGQGVTEIVSDRAALIIEADEAARAMDVEGVTWRDLVGIPSEIAKETAPGKAYEESEKGE